ncbi:GNAT family N-acetyltransferase [Paenibacillus sp. 1001270B_150601_E10]|uniref:GNAT family N-acetyltransferase n=1 Tax=Paenibacillus sp. 1001270B_150601_E10 TaxID=2787079 RepID=UPI0018A04325|nr:GNAT family N-acetyltransferase [Paenibacillus sp. 1001270B_150601_E10]
MNLALRKLSKLDDLRFFQMMQEMGPGENGFHNSMYGLNPNQFRHALSGADKMSRGLFLQPQFVAQTSYWLMLDDHPLGLGKLRHELNASLRERGGHIGYAIRPSERGKGYGHVILQLLVEEAGKRGMNEVLLTCLEDNFPSRRVIEANQGILHEIKNGICKYWIHITANKLPKRDYLAEALERDRKAKEAKKY